MFAKSKVALSLVITLAAASAAVARDDGPPSIDLQKLCRASQIAVGEMYGSVPINVFDSCISSEQAARETLVKDWATFSAADKALCVQPTVFQPSYIEWFTCAEMQRDVRKMRKEQPAAPAIPSARRQSPRSRTGSETKQCPIVQMRPDGSIASVVAC